MKHQPDLQRVVDFYESIALTSLSRLEEIYASDAYFKDPFNEVRGLAAIERIFRQMFEQVDGPRFVVTTQVLQGSDAFIEWDFLFRMKRRSKDEQCIRGSTRLRFDSSGRVDLHRDYWDAAEELYEKIPVLGGLMRALKHQARK